MATRRAFLIALVLSASFSCALAASTNSTASASTVSSSNAAPSFTARPAAAFVLQPDEYTALCWYPLSGNYGRAPRILFYASLLFALLARAHEWLIAGALAASLSYSGVAAIHACMMVWRGPAFGENDFWALLAILSTSCILTVPMINWSKTLRNLGADHERDSNSRTIIIYWGFLVSIGFLCIFVANFDNSVPFSIYSLSVNATTTCVPPGGKMNYSAGQNPVWDILRLDSDFLERNNCPDPCSGNQLANPFTYEPVQSAIFRSSTEAQALSMQDINYILRRPQKQTRSQEFFLFYVGYGLWVLPYILTQGIWAVSFGRRSPREVRDLVYFWLRRRKVPYLTSDWAQQRNFRAHPRAVRIQRAASWFQALLVYLWAIFVTAICLPLLVIDVIASEIELAHVPQSESADHVGAWAPYAATGLVLFAAAVARYQDGVLRVLKKTEMQALNRLSHLRHPQKGKGQQKNGTTDSEKGREPSLQDHSGSSSQGLYPKIVKETGWSALHTLGGPSNRFKDRFLESLNVLQLEWSSFRHFCRNPDEPFDFDPRWSADHHRRWLEKHGRSGTQHNPAD